MIFNLKHDFKISMSFMLKDQKKFECWGFQSGIPYSGDYSFHNQSQLNGTWMENYIERRESGYNITKNISGD